jgi:uncharacterized membrane protein YfcA
LSLTREPSAAIVEPPRQEKADARDNGGSTLLVQNVAQHTLGEGIALFLALYLVFTSAVLLLVMSRYAHMTLADAGVSLISVLPVMIGMALGVKIRPHVPIKLFRPLILLVVSASAVDLIAAPLLQSLT